MEKYVVRVRGHIDSRYFTWCDGLSVTHTDDGETVLVVTIRDQAELHGLLAQIRDLSLPLLSLNRQHNISPENDNACC